MKVNGVNIKFMEGLKMKDFNSMSNEELISVCEEMEMEIIDLKDRLEKKGKGRKGEVLDILRENLDGISIKDIGKKIGIKNKNVSSLLSYLKDDGYEMWRNGEGEIMSRS